MTPEIKQKIEQIRRGEVPEGYKRTKAGVVPVEWEEVRIGDVLTQRKTLQCVSEDAPLLSFTIEEGVIDPANKKSNKRDFLIKDVTTKKFALTEVGDIIYNPANLKFGAIHRNNLRRGVVSPIYGIFYGEQDSIFMGYLLHNQRFIDYAKIYTEGTVEKLKTLKAETFLKLKITLPPIDEQKKIAKILLAQDKKIELQEKIISEMQTLKNICLMNMCPKAGELFPKWRFPLYTDTWKYCKLQDMSELITKGTSPLDKFDKGDINFIKVENIDSQSGEIIPKSKISIREHNGYLKRSQLKEKDILFSIAGTLGRIGVITKNLLPANTNQALAIIRPLIDNTDYIATVLKGNIVAEFIKKNPTIGAQPNLSLEQIAKMNIPCPSIEEQKAIGSYFITLDKFIKLNTLKLAELVNEKKALMQLLLTGIVRV